MIKIFCFLCYLMLTSCASTFQYVKFSDKEKTLNSGESRIKIVRPSIFAYAIKMKVYCNDKLIGKIGPKSYLSFDVKEGEYSVRTNAEVNEYFTIYAKAGKTYFLKLTPKFGLFTYRVSQESIDDSIGEPLLLKLRKPKLKYIE